MFKKKIPTEEQPIVESPRTFPKLPRLPEKSQPQVEEEEEEQEEQETEETETTDKPKGVTVDQIIEVLQNQEQRITTLEAALFRLKNI